MIRRGEWWWDFFDVFKRDGARCNE